MVRRGYAALLLIAVLLFTSGGAPAGEAGENVTASSGHTLTTAVSQTTIQLGAGPVSDTATLAGASNPTGTITFTLFPPTAPTCAGPPIFTSVVPVSGNGNYNSASFTPTFVGTFRWVAVYSGDANNTALTSPCNAANETVTVSQATPTITTSTVPVVTVGVPISDTALLTGGVNPTGLIGFSLFGPNDATCSLPPIFTAVVPLIIVPAAMSPPFFPAVRGTYRWRAAYIGDFNNAGVASACNDPNETVVVLGAATGITTTASPGITIGTGTLSDTAVLTGGISPTGSITFDLYGPNDATCSGPPVFTSTVPVVGAGIYPSLPFTPASAGVYRWVARYSGDTDDEPSVTACGDPNETVTVSQVATSVTTTASAGIVQGSGTLTDTANLSGGADPTGSITFNLYGPDDATCSGPAAFNSVVPVSGNGTYVSAAFAPALAGTYRWVAAYSGDVNDAPATTACNDPDETVVVTAAAVPTAPAAPAGAPGSDGLSGRTRLASGAGLPVTGMNPLRSLQAAAALLLFGALILLMTPRRSLARHTPQHRRRSIARYTPQHRRTRPGEYTPRHRRH